MRFLIPAQTFSEYQHRRMPVYETVAAIGGTTLIGSLTVGGLAASAATAGAGALAAYGANKLLNNGSGGIPSYNGMGVDPAQYYQNALKYIPTSADFEIAQQDQQKNILGSGYNPSQGFAQQFARMGTAQNIANQNKVTPGSSQQRELAQNQINQYIQGIIPQDVQQNIQREVAQNLGGGFNLQTGGGQAPQNFARNIGQTSLGLSQFGLSAAPTWQQLANSMVVSPTMGAQFALQAGQLGNQQVLGSAGLGMQASGLGMQNQENLYQSAMNQYAGQQQQNQQGMQMGMQGANFATGLLDSANKGAYYKSLLPSGQGLQNTLGGLFPSGLPSVVGSSSNDLSARPAIAFG